MFGRYSVLLDSEDLGSQYVTDNADMMIAVAIWRHMIMSKKGEPTLHDIAIGKWPAEGSDVEKALELVKASVFEMYWCNMLTKLATTESCKNDAQDLWRDLYIWNAMILNVEYETNGIASEWYWFENSEFDLTYNPTAMSASSL
jgi:hypothetical protein